jgi:hypothetical protein
MIASLRCVLNNIELAVGILGSGWLALSEPSLTGTLDRAAEDEDAERQRQREQDRDPASATASDTEGGSDPDRSRGGQALDTMLGVVVKDDTCSDESDARDDSLDHASDSIGARVRHRRHNHNGHRASKADQCVRAQPSRFAVEIAIDAEDGAGEDRAAKPSRKFDPFQVRHGSAMTCGDQRQCITNSSRATAARCGDALRMPSTARRLIHRADAGRENTFWTPLSGERFDRRLGDALFAQPAQHAGKSAFDGTFPACAGRNARRPGKADVGPALEQRRN